jgi:GT2 family glycosyltransferase
MELEGGKAAIPAAGAAATDAPVAPPLRDLSAVKEAHLRVAREQLRSFLAADATLDLPRSSEPVVSILLVLRNCAELTLLGLRSLSLSLPPATEVVIVDNASTDETGRLLRRIRGATVVHNPANEGYPKAVNQAAARARGRFLLLLNNDVQLLPGALEAAVRVMLEDPAAGAVAGRIVLLDGTLQEAGSLVWKDGAALGYGRGADPNAGEFLFRREVDFGSAAFLLTERELWERLGGYDLDFSPAYYEDIDYCFRLRAAGWRVIYEPDAAILHFEFGSSSSMASALEQQVQQRARFCAKHGAALAGQQTPHPRHVLRASALRRGRPPVLVLGDRAPHPWLGGASRRVAELVRGLATLGYPVTFYPLAAARDQRPLGGGLPPEVEVMFDGGPERLGAFTEARGDFYESIVVTGRDNLRRIEPFLGGLGAPRVICDAEALPDGAGPWALDRPGALRSALPDGVELLLTRSDSERLAWWRAGCRKARTVSALLEPDPGAEELAARDGLLFHGAVLDEDGPRAEALGWLLGQLLPKLEERAGHAVPLTCAGPVLVPGLRRDSRAKSPRTGGAGDRSSPFAAARLLVEPARGASDWPFGVLEAASQGVPAVSTPEAARKLGWRDGEHLLVADGADEFARACHRLLEDDRLWRRIRDGALGRVREECSRAGFLRALAEAMDFDALVGLPPRTGGAAWATGAPA